MKKTIYIVLIILAWSVVSCTPDKYDVKEFDMVDMDRVQEIALRLSHYEVLADGKACITFSPFLTAEEGYEVLDSRVDHSQIEYLTPDGQILSDTFCTADKSLIGETVRVYARIKGRDLTSNEVSFRVADPSIAETFPEITIPVVFHLLQSEFDVTAYGGEISAERIQLLLDKINNTFSGIVSNSATGVDTRIRFEPALYDPYGNKLSEPGINRVYADNVIDEGQDSYKTFIANQKALWPYDKYLNIWLVSDLLGTYETFYRTLSTTCIPRYVAANDVLADAPQGLALTELPADWNPVPNEVGILYKLQSIFKTTRTFGEESENELVNCIGYYFGLLPTWGVSDGGIPDDYCSDTHAYYGDENSGYNISVNKTVDDYYFLSENIMDDPTGVHRSITLQQAQRIHWVLNNCPERSAWKSDFAFTGKESMNNN